MSKTVEFDIMICVGPCGSVAASLWDEPSNLDAEEQLEDEGIKGFRKIKLRVSGIHLPEPHDLIEADLSQIEPKAFAHPTVTAEPA